LGRKTGGEEKAGSDSVQGDTFRHEVQRFGVRYESEPAKVRSMRLESSGAPTRK
jgi:hypothetical protein